MLSSGRRHGDEERAFRKRQEQRFPEHSCELPAQPNRVYPLLPPDASMWMRLRGVLQKQIIGWRKWRAFRLLRPSTYALEAEQAKQAHSRTWWVLHPYSRVFVLWQLIVIVAVFLHLLLWPLHYCFLRTLTFLQARPDEMKNVYILFLDEEDERTIEFQDTLLDWKKFVGKAMSGATGIYIIHLVVLFFTGYYDRIRNQVVMQPSRIIRRYLTSWFFVDLSSVWDYIRGTRDIVFYTFSIDKSLLFSYHYVLIWTAEFFVEMEQIRIHYLLEYVTNWCNMANARYITKNLIIFTICFFAFLQVGVYGSYKIPLLVRGIYIFKNNSRSWLADPDTAFFDLTQPYLLPRQYLIALHRVVGVSARYLPFQSLGEQTMEDRILLLILMWVALVFRIVLFALALQYVDSTNSGEVELAKVTHQIQTFMRHKQLPMHLRHKIQLFYGHSFDDRFFEERAILSNLPPSIHDAIRRATGRHLIGNSRLFQGIPKSLMNSIVSALQEDLFLPNDVVYSSGSPSHYLYFLSEGTVAVYLSTGEEVGHLEDGSYFGEMGLMIPEHKQRHIESVVALEVCEVFLLERHDFHHLVRPLPRLFNRIRAAAMLRAAEVQPVGFEYDDHDESRPLSQPEFYRDLTFFPFRAPSSSTAISTPIAFPEPPNEDHRRRSLKSTVKSLFSRRKTKQRNVKKHMRGEEEKDERQVMGEEGEEEDDEMILERRKKGKKFDTRKTKMKRNKL